jgi:MFS family permease
VGPLALGIARDSLPRERLRPAIGILVGAGGAGAAIGYVLSGVLVDHVSPASIFWLLFAVAIVLLAAVPAVVPASPPRSRVPVDVAGAALVAAGLGALLLAISKGNDWGWSSARVLGLFAAAAVLLAGFVLVERRVRHPLVELAFVAQRPFAQAAVCSFTVGFVMAVAPLAVPQLVALPAVTGYGLGYSTTDAGLVLVPMALSTMVAAYAAGRLVQGVGPRALMAAGAVCAGIAYVSLAVAHETGGQIAAATGVLGIAVGLTITGIAAVVVPSAPIEKTSIAAAVPNIVRTTGIALGAAVSAAIITGALTVGPVPAESGYTRTFVAGAIAAGCALLAAALLPGRATRASAP